MTSFNNYFSGEPPPDTPETTPECVVNVLMAPCGTVYELEGSCEQNFNFPDQCELKVKQVSMSRYQVFDATTNSTVFLELGTDLTQYVIN